MRTAAITAVGPYLAVLVLIGFLIQLKGKAKKAHPKIPSAIVYVLATLGPNEISEDDLRNHVNGFLKDNDEQEISLKAFRRSNNLLVDLGVIKILDGNVILADTVTVK